jgi:hypothetical protein
MRGERDPKQIKAPLNIYGIARESRRLRALDLLYLRFSQNLRQAVVIGVGHSDERQIYLTIYDQVIATYRTDSRNRHTVFYTYINQLFAVGGIDGDNNPGLSLAEKQTVGADVVIVTD